MKKPKRPKSVNYVLIQERSDIGRPMYELLFAILDEHHTDLSRSNVRVALAWATSWKADVDGRLMLGKCKKASDLDRELAPFDFVILLNRDFWQNPRVTDLQRKALLDHELMHAAVAYDDNGEAKTDARGRTVYRVRKHDLEEFADIAARYGCWKRDIEAFAHALTRAELSATAWVGYTSLRTALLGIGIELPVEVISEWPAPARRDVMTWVQLRKDAGPDANAVLSPTMPAILHDTLKQQPTGVQA